jgi:hypothetical protein
LSRERQRVRVRGFFFTESRFHHCSIGGAMGNLQGNRELARNRQKLQPVSSSGIRELTELKLDVRKDSAHFRNEDVENLRAFPPCADAGFMSNIKMFPMA